MNTNKELILECNAKAFKEVLKHVNAYTSSDWNRAMLCGVRFFLEDGELTLTATDGNHLSERQLKIDSKISNFSEIHERDYLLLNTDKDFMRILSGVTKNTILKVYQEGKEDRSFYTFETEVKAKITAFNNCEREIKSISLGDIAGNYPNYKTIIPSGEVLKYQITFKGVETIQFLKDLKQFMGGFWSYEKKIAFYKVDNKHFIYYEGLDKEVDFIESSDLLEGEPLALNVVYLLDALEDKPEIATFRTEDFVKSVIYRHEDGKIDLVMPMRSDDIKLPSWEKKKESLSNKPDRSAKESPKFILSKFPLIGKERCKAKKTRELLKKEFSIQFKTCPKLYRKIYFQLKKGA